MTMPCHLERDRLAHVRSLRQQSRDLERFAVLRLEAGRPREGMLRLAARRAARADELEAGRAGPGSDRGAGMASSAQAPWS